MGPQPTSSKLYNRVAKAATLALADHSDVCFTDLMCGIGWIAPVNVEAWKLGRIAPLATAIAVSREKQAAAVSLLRRFAAEHGLVASEVAYARRGRDGMVALQFGDGTDPEWERLCRTHFVSPHLPEKKRQKLQEKLDDVPGQVVFQAISDRECDECGVAIERDDFAVPDGDASLCLACAHLDDLEFLAAGDAALTRRATRFSTRVAKVLRFNRSRKRYERQGILAEPAAIEKAEASCVEDAPQRAAARARDAIRRQEQDRVLVARMIEEIANAFPGCPRHEVEEIARHTATRGSGRVGRSAAGRELDPDALKLAVIASIRHRHTDYDEMLARSVDRQQARSLIADRIEAKLDDWRS